MTVTALKTGAVKKRPKAAPKTPAPTVADMVNSLIQRYGERGLNRQSGVSRNAWKGVVEYATQEPRQATFEAISKMLPSIGLSKTPDELRAQYFEEKEGRGASSKARILHLVKRVPVEQLEEKMEQLILLLSPDEAPPMFSINQTAENMRLLKLLTLLEISNRNLAREGFIEALLDGCATADRVERYTQELGLILDTLTLPEDPLPILTLLSRQVAAEDGGRFDGLEPFLQYLGLIEDSPGDRTPALNGRRS